VGVGSPGGGGWWSIMNWHAGCMPGSVVLHNLRGSTSERLGAAAPSAPPWRHVIIMHGLVNVI
jgi:hypothetical protein